MAERPLDRLHIQGLQARCIVGINADERRRKQDVVIDIALGADLRDACAHDEIAETVDYKAVKEDVLALVEGSSCRLLERLAERIAETCLARRRVREVRVRIAKPGALRFARAAAVEIVRVRQTDD